MVEQDEIVVEQEAAAPSALAPRKRRRAAADGTSGASITCDDVLGNILARLPARTAVACTALSKHHGRLVRSAEFRSLHCRLAPPLPRPHVAYVATAPIRRAPDLDPVTAFHGFHVAGTGAGGDAALAPMRALAGGKYLGTKYVNTCNGLVLLAGDKFSPTCRCTLWNPAVADGARDVTVASSEDSECLVLGLGCGRRSGTYKLLLCYKDARRRHDRRGLCCDRDCRVDYSLLLYALGDAEKEPRQHTVISAKPHLEISQNSSSLYLDGMIYIVHIADSKVILAFSVDDETFGAIDLPDPQQYTTVLMEVSGHLCVVTDEDEGRSYRSRKVLWFLTADRRWEQRFVIGGNNPQHLFRTCLVVGVWDFDGVLVLFVQDSDEESLCLYHVATKKLFRAIMPADVEPRVSGYEWAWGYRPTLVSPGSIVGELDEDVERRRGRAADMTRALKPVHEQDMKKGRKATLDVVCFMEFLVRVMRKLPNDIQDVVEMPSMDSDDPLFSSVDA